MAYQKDFRDLLELLNENEVEYVIIGAHALAYHGAPRYTGDMDIYVRPTDSNAKKILNALTQFGFGSLGLKLEDFSQPDRVVQLGFPPVRIDLMTSISGVTWEESYSGSITDYYGGTLVRYLGRDEFVMNKRASGRKKDLADLEAIGEE